MSCLRWWQCHDWNQWAEKGEKIVTDIYYFGEKKGSTEYSIQRRSCRRCGLIQVQKIKEVK